MTIFNILYVVAAVILLFGAAIFVHEFGHYWVARRRGMKVEEFAIGFGPRVLGWRKDGIDYTWRAIPAGGYVKLPQMVTSEALEGKGEEKAEPIPPASPLSKILVAFAGPFMNVVFAFVIATLIYFVGLPVPVNPPVIGHLPADSEEAKLGIKTGDQIVSVNGKPVRTWQEVIVTAALARTNVMPVVIEHNGAARTYQLTAKADDSLGLKTFNLFASEHQIVGSIESGSPAEQAKFQPNDRFISFAGVPILSREQLVEIIGKRAGVRCEAVVERDSKQLTLTVTPKMDEKMKRGRIGIGFAAPKFKYQVQKPGPLPWTQVADVFDKTFDTLSALFYSKQTGVGIKDLSGPPGILVMLASQVNTDYRLALSFLVLLNINLAILNLLPVPVLDGGHIVMSVIEKIRRRPLSVKFVEYTTTGFAVLLISLMLYVSFNDVKRFPLFKSMFTRDAQIDQSPTVAPASAK